MCVTVMLVLPVWTQVESKNTLASHLCVLEAVVIYSKLTFAVASPPPRFLVRQQQPAENQTSPLDWCESQEPRGRGGHAVLLKTGLVTRSDPTSMYMVRKIN